MAAPALIRLQVSSRLCRPSSHRAGSDPAGLSQPAREHLLRFARRGCDSRRRKVPPDKIDVQGLVVDDQHQAGVSCQGASQWSGTTQSRRSAWSGSRRSRRRARDLRRRSSRGPRARSPESRAVVASAFSRRVASQPSIRGSDRSINIRSGFCFCRPCQSGHAIFGKHQTMLILEKLRQQFAIRFDVFDDQNGLHGSR